MKKNTKIILSTVVAASLLLGAGGAAYASGNIPQINNEKNEDVYEAQSDSYELTQAFDMNDEVAYVFTNYDGTVDRVMDSIWLENGSNRVDTGNEADLPVDVKLAYFLDGKKVTPAEITGKSGHLKVTCDFTDNVYELMSINGKEEKIFVPYMASLITVMEDEKYENVTVSSGKVTFDGSRYAVLGLAFPGFKEDLGTTLEDIDIPGRIEVEADVTDFEPVGIYLLVSDSVFSEMDLDTDAEIEKVEDAVDQLNEAVEKMMDGSSKLYDGLGKLRTGAGQISDGVNELSDGLTKIDSNSKALNDGALSVFNALLNTATEQINAAGISVPVLTVNNYNDVINSAIGQINATDVAGIARSKVEAGVKEYAGEHAAENLQAAENAARVQVEEKVREATLAQVRAGVEAKRGEIEAAVRTQVEANIDAIRAQVKAGILQNMGADYDSLDEETKAVVDASVETKTAETIEAMVSQNTDAAIEAKVSEIYESADTQNLINTNIEAAMNSDEVKAGIQQGINEKIDQAINEKYNSPEVQGQIAAGNAEKESGVKKLKSLQSQLNSYAQFYKGVQDYTGAVGQAATGAAKLKGAMPEFIEGIDALKKGEGELSDGIERFDKEGIEKINSLVHDNVEGFSERLKAMSDIAKSHASYDDSGSEKGNVKYIYKVNAGE
ncbi:MAG: hypothetical protein K6D96_10695 [Acetatifactor sp.]|nr:hypothetical protein [Acetatifactor sp.]